MQIEIPTYNDNHLVDMIKRLEIRVKKLEGYELVVKKDLPPSQIGFLIGCGGINNGDELLLLEQGIYEWRKI